MSERTPLPPWRVRTCDGIADFDKAMAVRFEVFVNEQKVPAELEPDEYDDVALHLIAEITETGEALGTARVVDKGEGIAKIGRVAVLQKARGYRVGEALMQFALEQAITAGQTLAILDAQVQVIPFYERLGFVAEGPEFDDAGIPHRRMTKRLESDTTNA
jgi:predicted GNAT family N-acyltransferase